jgi:hypothetical protein
MTCIVGTPQFLAADRRIVADGQITSMVKIAKNKWLIAAASGNASCTLAVRNAVRKGAQNVHDLLEYVDRDSYAIALQPSGTIWLIQERSIWDCKTGEMQAIGSGGDLALGYLRCNALCTAEDIRLALRFVAKRRADCGGGCDVRHF